MPTNFPHGVMSMGAMVGPVGVPLGGTHYFVKPYSGSNGNSGLSPDNAVKTLAKALALATAGKNDVVHLISESNTAAYTTDYLSTTLDWNKDMVHLVGENAGCGLDQRSRVAWSSTLYDGTATPLFTLSADSCLIANIQFIASINDAQAIGCVDITGERNRVVSCHIAGIGNDTQDAAGAYSLYLNGAESTELWNCYIGLNTTAAGTAANSEILIANTVKNVFFNDCMIYRRIEHGTNHPLVKIAAATSIEELICFTRCKFISMATNDLYSNAGVFKWVASPTQGYIILDHCFGWNGTTAGKWDVDDYDNIIAVNSPTPAADTVGLARAV